MTVKQLSQFAATVKPGAADVLREFLSQPERTRERVRHLNSAKRQAAEAASMSTPDLLRAELAKQSRASTTMPLNGTQVLNAALAGGAGTINASAADLLRRGLMSVQDGRNE